MRCNLVVTAVFVAASTLASAQQPADKDWTAPAAAWWSHVQYLADDKLQGRKTGTLGYEAAVQYVEQQYKAMGLKPAGIDGYRQPFRLVPTSVDNTASSFAVDNTTYALGTEVMLSPHVASAATVDAPMVFIGYGLSLPRRHMDDFAGIDLHGKIAVLINAAPAGLQGPQRAYARAIGERWKALHAAGAIGVVLYTVPRPGTPPNPSGTPTNPPPTMLFEDPDLETLPGLRIAANLTAAGATRFFAGTGHTFPELKALADAGKPLPHFAITGTLHAHTVVKTLAPIAAPNVVAQLPGSDKKLSKEFVVISAHLDHLGVGRPVDGDPIYNGAMDNASGIASLLEAARILAAGPHPRRSVLFVAFAGEELGELGSQYFATKPTVPKTQIVADLNMDMFLPLFPLQFLEVQGLGESTLGNDARAVCQLNDIEVQFDKQPSESRFTRSDQVNFVKQGIPAIAFKFGWVPDSPEEKVFNEWTKTRYHKPSDDLDQPVDKVAAAQFSAVLVQLAARVANAPVRPTWYPESSFAVGSQKPPAAP